MSSACFPPSMRRLINELSKLPSIGEKSAFRLAQYILANEESECFELADAIRKARQAVKFCRECFSYTESEICEICQDPLRDKSLICVVEKPVDVIAVERASSYRGLYHVLHGLWSPLRGVRPEHTTVGELVQRIKRSHENSNGTELKNTELSNAEPKNEPKNAAISELIIATSTTVEGDATATYISQSVSHLPVTTTRVAQGLPKGGELEYADETTLKFAIEGRKTLA